MNDILHAVVDYKIFQDVKRSGTTLKNNTTPIFPVKVLPIKNCQNLKTKLFFKTLCFKIEMKLHTDGKKSRPPIQCPNNFIV